MKRLTKAEAEQKFPGVEFTGDVRVGDDVVVGRNARIGRGAVVHKLEKAKCMVEHQKKTKNLH